ncbi:MAG: alpha-galactosidase [Pirellulaceae bacterium]
MPATYAIHVLLLSTLVLAAVPASADEKQALRVWAERALLGVTTPVAPQPGLELRRQEYDALGLGKSSRLGPLQIGEKRYEHGLGTHAESEIVVRLEKPGQKLQAEVGVDRGWPGSVEFVVEVAGQEVFKSGVLRVDSPSVPVNVDLGGATEFTLRVLDGGDGPSSDHANWADAAVTLADGQQIWLDQLPLTGAVGLLGELPFSFVYAGKPSAEFLSSWQRQAESNAGTDGRERHTITYTDPVTGLQVVCEATLFADFPAAEWVLHFRNTGTADTPIIQDIRPLDVKVAVPNGHEVVLHHSQGSTCQSTDFQPLATPVATGTDIQLAPNGGRSSDGALPFFNLQWSQGGLVGAVGWSGQWALRVHRASPGELQLHAGQQTTHFKLQPSETVRTPRILLVMWQGQDPLRGHNLFRRLLMAHYLPQRDGQVAVAPTTWNSWFSFNEGNGVNEENQLDWIERTARSGMECYWLDAGWFEGGWPAGVGNWVPGPEQFPRGLRPLGEAAHRAGMKFVLWLEPERVSPNSRLAKEHPEWVLHAGAGDGLLNLGDPAARMWLTDHISKSFQEWGVDVLRQDFNIDPLRFWQAADAPDRQGITEIRHVTGLYELWDELVRRQPGLTIDNCASGGRRIDLETVSRSYPLWRSDTPCVGFQAWPVWDQVQVAGLSLYVPQHTGGVWGLDPYTFRSAATMGVSVCRDVRAKDYSAETTHSALSELNELRPLYLGDYYPLFDINTNEQVWCGWQFDRPELGRGFAVVLRRPQSPYARADLQLRGLVAEARYEVEWRESYEVKDKRVLTGAELAQLRIEIGTAPGSVLVTYRQVELAPTSSPSSPATPADRAPR